MFGVHPWSETRKQVKVLQGRTDARTTIPDLQPRVQGGGGSPDPGGREVSRRGRGPGTAVAVAVHLARLLRTGPGGRARAAGAAAAGDRVGPPAGPRAATEPASARPRPRRE